MDWEAPDARPEQPVPAPPPSVMSPRDQPGVGPAPVRLTPLTRPELLDGSLELLRRRPRDVLTIAVAVLLPVELLVAAFGSGRTVPFDPRVFTDPEAISGEGTDVAAFVSWAGGAVALVVVAGAMGVLVDRSLRQLPCTAADALGVTFRRLPALGAVTVLVHLLEFVGLFALGIGAYVAMAFCQVAAPVVTVESVGPVRAIRRSFALTRRQAGPSFVVPLLVAIVSGVLGLLFLAVPSSLAEFVGPDWRWLVRGSGAIAASLLTTPFVAGVAVLYHLDLRMRVEGEDIALRADAVLAR